MPISYKQVGRPGMTLADVNRANRKKWGDEEPEDRGREDAADPTKDPKKHEFEKNPHRREEVCSVCGRGKSAHMEAHDSDEDRDDEIEDSFKGLVEKLEKEGKSHEYATKIAAKVNREKYPPNGKH